MKKDIEKIMRLYLEDFIQKKGLSCVINNSVPIIWFGNIEKYFSSKTKIITVALNPSKSEFPEDEIRFPEAIKNPDSLDALYESLNNYFITNPYYSWFRHYEKILNHFNASYNGNGKMRIVDKKFENTSIHIDIYTAIATNPVWSKLKKEERYEITNTKLFKNLLSLVNPDIILISARKKIVEQELNLDESMIFFKQRTKDGGKIGIDAFKSNNRLVVWGNNWNIPFASMKDVFIKECCNKIISEQNL